MRKITDLAALIMEHAPQSSMAGTAVSRLSLIRADRRTVPVPSVYEASLCLVAQGSKRVSLGEDSMFYNASRYLLVSVDLPLVGHVLEASPQAPYLCCKIDLDMAALADLMIAQDAPAPKSDLPVLAVYPSDPDLVDTACRLVNLLERPESIAGLAPLIEEILYRLRSPGCVGRCCGIWRQRTAISTRSAAPLPESTQASTNRCGIEEIAAVAGMSSSSLHAHFKAITRMTPLEYQKQLRLQEARRLMLTEGANAGAAGFALGYESQSQFSREYLRLFGAPPWQDIDRLQNNEQLLATA